MMVKFTSSVVVAGFLGVDVLNEKLKDKSIVDALLKLADLGTISFNDPLLLIFGNKLLKRGWRAFDREFMELLNDVN